MINRLESHIFSRIKASFSPELKKAYLDLTFTTSDRTPTVAKFPTVYIHLMPSPAVGRTLSGKGINGINAGFQIEVSDNQKQERADEIAKEVLRIMTSILKFDVSMFPNHQNTGDVYRTVARYQRIVGSGDIL